MGDDVAKDSSAKSMDYSWVLALPAPSLSRSVRPPQPKEKKPRVNEKKHEETHWNTLTINQGQDIGEEVLTYFRNRTKSENSNGHAWMGKIISSVGFVMHPILNRENSPSSDKGSYDITSLKGSYIISEDGQVQQSGPLTILCAGPSNDIIGGAVIGRLIAAGDVEVTVTAFHIPS
ncbi:AT-hook motif nuclear-localized protein 8-like [Solanum dulcamara]|uniref:AT-hook motif nuclear-localized protein 8-like n=1 Tax=Solanum dulcamara TaxID=45834 RepID=UPI0024866435|nr:AT-hook motif nuclear-localized protein 8-like [Solanum dulcamara]